MVKVLGINLKMNILLLLFIMISTAVAQDYFVRINSVTPTNYEKNLFGQLKACDFQIDWSLMEGNQEVSNVTPFSFRVYVLGGRESDDILQIASVGDTTRHTIADQETHKDYFFKVEALDDNNKTIASSNIQKSRGGSQAGDVSSAREPGRKTTVWERIYSDDSTPVGKISFTIILLFFVAGVFYIFWFRCRKNLKFRLVFPFKRESLIRLPINKDRYFENYISPRFLFLIEAWKKIMERTNEIVRKGTGGLTQLNQACYNDFRDKGIPAINVLREIINMDPKRVTEEQKQKIIKDINTYFGENADFGDLMSNGIEIEQEYRFKSTSGNKLLITWEEIENDLFNKKAKPLLKYPTVKIFSAGLENHRINGYQWDKVSEEVDRAIESRSYTEINKLTEKSFLDWLWNLGTVAPLLGLLGTVSGLSNIFQKIESLPPDVEHMELIRQLADGIFEALYTTIFGLLTGILLTLIYYYYKNVLDWIYGKWQAIFVPITERL
ncbi:MAG: MotA/TolQ/ExbB proton channel family protein [candidate division KSB1 bacterium]|nr:MotA/TolQ/ExbB proton channel family protein [candidate division KSB1 bacterium]